MTIKSAGPTTMNSQSSSRQLSHGQSSQRRQGRPFNQFYNDGVSSLGMMSSTSIKRTASARTTATMSTVGTISTNASSSTTHTSASATTERTKIDLSNFRELPPFEAFTKVSWAMVACQVITGIFGVVLSYHQNNGQLAGIMSGIVGLWFIQMSWVMSLPSKCSRRPYHVALALLPFTKSIGFLLVDDADGNFCDWYQFLRRMAILSTMWVIPIYLAGRNTAEVVRCIHGDVSRYDSSGKHENGNLFAVRRQSGEELDEEGVEIRQRAMACTVKYLFIFPLVVYITFNAIGAVIEASEYAMYTTMEGDSFEITTGTQFYVDFVRAAYSSILQGLVTVFSLITVSGLGCSAMDLGEIMRFRLHPLEGLALGSNGLFFVAYVYFGSPLFNPLDPVQYNLADWCVYVLPCFLLLCLWRLTTGVLQNKNSLRNQRLEEAQDDGETDNLLGRPSSIFGVPGFGFGHGERRSSRGSRRSGVMAMGGTPESRRALGLPEPINTQQSTKQCVSSRDRQDHLDTIDDESEHAEENSSTEEEKVQDEPDDFLENGGLGGGIYDLNKVHTSTKLHDSDAGWNDFMAMLGK